MISDFFSAKWAAVAPELGNHLWQSTLFAIVAGLLALLLRKNHARIRYGIWLAASIKFLVPFSVLVWLGSHLASPRATSGTSGQFYFEVRQFSQPFLLESLPVVPRPSATAVAAASPMHLLPLFLAATWLTGLVAVLLIWCVRWRQVNAILRNAEPMAAGRELATLRRLERMSGRRRPLAVVLSPASLEPGVFGIARPVLIWPAGISLRLEDAHLEAILAHELCHIRRHDNLTATLHMLVEAVFWFHPLVWWVGARLVEERERACDEHVLTAGSQRQAYAESILKTCEFCVESPLACVSGITGDDLKQRIVRIMAQGLAEKLNFGRKLLLWSIAIASLAGPVVFGLMHSPRAGAQAAAVGAASLTFDVASIKPDHMDGHHTRISYDNNSFVASGVTLKRLIEFAYNMNDFQLSGGPDWLDSETFEVQAKMDQSTVAALNKIPREQRAEQRRIMVQLLLADRFNLKVSHSSKELPVYVLVLTKNGAKFSPSPPSDGGQTRFSNHNSDLKANGVAINGFAEWLSHIVGRKVVDRTGLQGKYDLTLKWTPERQDPGPGGPAGGPTLDSPSPDYGPSIFVALQEQLGLKLESQKGPVDTLIIESAQKPSPN